MNPQKIAKDIKNLPNWRNFAKSGHTGKVSRVVIEIGAK